MFDRTHTCLHTQPQTCVHTQTQTQTCVPTQRKTYMFAYTCFTYVHSHTCLHTKRHRCKHGHPHTRASTHVQRRMCTDTYPRAHTHTRCVHTLLHICLHTHTHTHTHKLKHKHTHTQKKKTACRIRYGGCHGCAHANAGIACGRSKAVKQQSSTAGLQSTRNAAPPQQRQQQQPWHAAAAAVTAISSGGCEGRGLRGGGAATAACTCLRASKASVHSARLLYLHAAHACFSLCVTWPTGVWFID
jgi:hypothetical protein